MNQVAGITGLLRRLVPLPARASLRAAVQQFSAGMASLRTSGQQDPWTPPRWLNFAGDGDFATIGARYLRHLIELGGLRPNHRVLDVGCGVGRIAGPLTRYLSPPGSYEGLDVVRAGIRWCQKTITRRHPHFRFQWIDVWNRAYNPRGRCQGSAFTFPFPAEHFDFVILTSVFTHMLPDDLEHYLAEVSRLLKEGGKCLITFFLLNAESRSLAQVQPTRPVFRHERGDYVLQDAELPEAAVAYEEAFVRRLFERYQLRILEPIHHGGWCGRRHCRDGQDLVVAFRE